MNDAYHPEGMSEDDMPYAMSNVNTLLKKLGPDVPLDKIFTKEKIEACQKIIETAKADFFQDAIDSIANISKKFSKANSDITNAKPHVRHIAQLSKSLKAKVEMLGIRLIYDVAHSLHGYAATLSSYTPKTLMVIGKHIEIMEQVFNSKTTVADDEPMAREMINNLAKLVRKVQT